MQLIWQWNDWVGSAEIRRENVFSDDEFGPGRRFLSLEAADCWLLSSGCWFLLVIEVSSERTISGGFLLISVESLSAEGERVATDAWLVVVELEAAGELASWYACVCC